MKIFSVQSIQLINCGRTVIHLLSKQNPCTLHICTHFSLHDMTIFSLSDHVPHPTASF